MRGQVSSGFRDVRITEIGAAERLYVLVLTVVIKLHAVFVYVANGLHSLCTCVVSCAIWYALSAHYVRHSMLLPMWCIPSACGLYKLC